LDREVKFVLSSAQMLFGFGAVPRHIVVIGGTRTFHFVNGLDYMPVNRIKIVPITCLSGKLDTGDKRCGERKNHENLFHLYVLRAEIVPGQKPATYPTPTRKESKSYFLYLPFFGST
jgi:hypothetical protein